MWIFTNKGFISVVADRGNPETGNLLVRSRDRNHLEELFPQAEIFSKTPSDYKWRAWISRSAVSKLMQSQVDSLNYTNFKNSIEDDKYHDACLDVWEVMFSAYR
jgi:hypothetical protein